MTLNGGTSAESPTILLTGATGYIGGRLLRILEKQGYRVRCLARRPEYVRQTPIASTEVVAGDVLDRPSLDRALSGVETAYYLVHSLGSSGSFEESDRLAARNFGQAAKACGVKGIIYVGGLGSDQAALSPHLRSRQEVGHILRESGVPVLEFRASIVIGSGSLSFEMIRSLYSMYEIGGADRVSYADIMREYARQRGLRIRMLPVPALTPYLSSLWLALVTPLYARIGRKLIESIIHPTVVRDDVALGKFAVRPIGIQEAIRRALAHEEREFADTRWSDALSSSGQQRSWGGVRFGTRLVDSRTLRVTAPAAAAFAPIQAIGGDTGWYGSNWLWRLRGLLDLVVGGVGMRRGRRHPALLRVGDTVDFWRVEALEPDRRLRLVAEMKLPGRAWLEFEVVAEGTSTTIQQTAIFDPVGWSGLCYWYALFPLHEIVFAGMLRGIASRALKARPVVHDS